MAFWTRAALMRESGRSLYEIDKLLSLGLPHERIGQGRGGEIRVPREKAISWLVGFVLDAKADPESTPEFTRERTRLAKEQADKLAMENAVARRELLPADEVRRADEVVFIALRDRVMQVESAAIVMADLAAAGDRAGARAALRQALRDALEEVGSADLVSLQAKVSSDAAA